MQSLTFPSWPVPASPLSTAATSRVYPPHQTPPHHFPMPARNSCTSQTISDPSSVLPGLSSLQLQPGMCCWVYTAPSTPLRHGKGDFPTADSHSCFSQSDQIPSSGRPFAGKGLVSQGLQPNSWEWDEMQAPNPVPGVVGGSDEWPLTGLWARPCIPRLSGTGMLSQPVRWEALWFSPIPIRWAERTHELPADLMGKAGCCVSDGNHPHSPGNSSGKHPRCSPHSKPFPCPAKGTFPSLPLQGGGCHPPVSPPGVFTLSFCLARVQRGQEHDSAVFQDDLT